MLVWISSHLLFLPFLCYLGPVAAMPCVRSSSQTARTTNVGGSGLPIADGLKWGHVPSQNTMVEPEFSVNNSKDEKRNTAVGLELSLCVRETGQPCIGSAQDQSQIRPSQCRELSLTLCARCLDGVLWGVGRQRPCCGHVSACHSSPVLQPTCGGSEPLRGN